MRQISGHWTGAATRYIHRVVVTSIVVCIWDTTVIAITVHMQLICGLIAWCWGSKQYKPSQMYGV